MNQSLRNIAIVQAIVILFVMILLVPHITGKVGTTGELIRVGGDLRMLSRVLDDYRTDYGVFPSPSTNQTFPTTPDDWFSSLPVDTYQTHRRYERTRWNAFVLYRLYFLIVFSIIAMTVIVIVIKRGPYSGNHWSLLPLILGILLINQFLYIFLKDISPVEASYGNYYLVPVTKHENSSYTFHYFTDSKDRFVIQSLGPDSDRDVEDLSGLFERYESDDDLKSYLDTHTYDSPNGLFSSGDLFWIRNAKY